jgi:hypothetical protein
MQTSSRISRYRGCPLSRGKVIGAGKWFDDTIFENGAGGVTVGVFNGGLFNGNVYETGRGNVLIGVELSGLFNGNASEQHAGNMSTLGTGRYNGRTKEEGPGSCSNTIANFNGSPCE